MSTRYIWESSDEPVRYFQNPEDAFHGGMPIEGTSHVWTLAVDGNPTEIKISENPRTTIGPRYRIDYGTPDAFYVVHLKDAQAFGIRAYLKQICNTALVHADDCVPVSSGPDSCEAEISCPEPVEWKFGIGGGWSYLCDFHWMQLPSADEDCECLTCTELADDMEAERRAFSKQRRIES
jgi:hypothetical protein